MPLPLQNLGGGPDVEIIWDEGDHEFVAIKEESDVLSLAELEAQEWEAQTAKLKSEAESDSKSVLEQILFYKTKADRIESEPISPDRVAVSKREKEAQLRVLKAQQEFLDTQLEIKAKREKDLAELMVQKERARRAESERDEALIAWQSSQSKESRELSIQIRDVKAKVAQTASENDALLGKLQKVANDSVPPESPSVRPKVKVSSSKILFANVGVPFNPSMKLLGGAPGREEEEETISKAPSSPKVSVRRTQVSPVQSSFQSGNPIVDALYGLGTWYDDDEEVGEGSRPVAGGSRAVAGTRAVAGAPVVGCSSLVTVLG